MLHVPAPPCHQARVTCSICAPVRHSSQATRGLVPVPRTGKMCKKKSKISANHSTRLPRSRRGADAARGSAPTRRAARRGAVRRGTSTRRSFTRKAVATWCCLQHARKPPVTGENITPRKHCLALCSSLPQGERRSPRCSSWLSFACQRETVL